MSLNKSIVINVNKKSSSNEQTYLCEYCSKKFSSRQSRWRHIKTCNKKSVMEKRIEDLEKSVNLTIEPKIESLSMIKLMNKQIKSILVTNQIIEKMYWDAKLKKFYDELKQIINLNIKMFKLTAVDYKNFNKELKTQIVYNLNIINKLEKNFNHLEYNGDNQYKFRRHVNKLRKMNYAIPQKTKEFKEEIICFRGDIQIELPNIKNEEPTNGYLSEFSCSTTDNETDSSYDI